MGKSTEKVMFNSYVTNYQRENIKVNGFWFLDSSKISRAAIQLPPGPPGRCFDPSLAEELLPVSALQPDLRKLQHRGPLENQDPGERKPITGFSTKNKDDTFHMLSIYPLWLCQNCELENHHLNSQVFPFFT